jgi:ribulose-phosphate 3-epimerase
MVKLAPSILSADFSALLESVKSVEDAGVDYLHVDIMDGHFVPNISFGPMVLKALKGKTKLPMDVHLMIENPDEYLEAFVSAGADIITIHVEACPHLHRSIQHIKQFGVKAGVSLNPGTSLSTLEEILPDVDLVLVMTVNPGFGGQAFIESQIDKIKRLKAMIVSKGLETLIEVDGGVTLDNAALLKAAGVDILVAGSAIYGADDIQKRVAAFRDCLR